ncbi:MAG: 2'-deoxycytidine 5'-triphosphate deaminase [Nitrospinae bacterium]|nr:2'-deoxycytidine 5'-triphosphate deaminase [Nitrospinota bacterium]
MTDFFDSNGVLPDHILRDVIREGYITSDLTIDDSCIQPSSLDLRLGPVCYRIRSSFLPHKERVMEGVADLEMYQIDISNGAILEKGNVYLIPLLESLNLPPNISARTNPKSSTGRLDIFTRVITDYGCRFEDIEPGYKGGLYMEIVPKSFTIKVKAGQALNQLRLFTAGSGGDNCVDASKITDSELLAYYKKDPLLYYDNGQAVPADKAVMKGGLFMGIGIGSASGDREIVGYKAKKNSAVIDLDNIRHYDVEEYWEPIMSHPDRHIILEPEEFYIFASTERVRVPLDMAGEMVEFDAGSGEVRTHYAGFFDSGFGYGQGGEIKGTKAVLEVRPHDVPFRIEDGQIFCKIKYERMLQSPSSYYGADIGSHYHKQGLALSKHFKNI